MSKYLNLFFIIGMILVLSSVAYAGLGDKIDPNLLMHCEVHEDCHHDYGNIKIQLIIIKFHWA